MAAFFIPLAMLIIYLLFKITGCIPWPGKLFLGVIFFCIGRGDDPSFKLIGGILLFIGLIQAFQALVYKGASEVATEFGASKETAHEVGKIAAGVAGGLATGAIVRGTVNTVQDAYANSFGTNVGDYSNSSTDYYDNGSYQDYATYGNLHSDSSIMNSWMDGTSLERIPAFYNNPDSSLLGLIDFENGQHNFAYYDSNGTPMFTVDAHGNMFDNYSHQIGQISQSSIFGANGKKFVDMTGNVIFETVSDAAGTQIISNNRIIGTIRGGVLYSPDGKIVSQMANGVLYGDNIGGKALGRFSTI